ncbi:MAG: biopolymer transporter ExbD [Candidatus Omnitrophica bacterium]|nr:biopolymer transporter ExbD [Candidatus Omnitrophota bacterium]
MINIKGKSDYLVALESVAMTDIVLNMFIFFFISFSLLYTFNPSRVSKIDVKLPKASSAISLKGSGKTILAITKEGEFFIDDERIAPDDFKKVLQLKLKDDPGLSLLLKVDSAARFDNVVRALDAINELNIQKVSIAAMKKD